MGPGTSVLRTPHDPQTGQKAASAPPLGGTGKGDTRGAAVCKLKKVSSNVEINAVLNKMRLTIATERETLTTPWAGFLLAESKILDGC